MYTKLKSKYLSKKLKSTFLKYSTIDNFVKFKEIVKHFSNNCSYRETI